MGADDTELPLTRADRAEEHPVRDFVRRRVNAAADAEDEPSRQVFVGDGFIALGAEEASARRSFEAGAPFEPFRKPPNRALGLAATLATAPVVFVLIVIASLAMFGKAPDEARLAASGRSGETVLSQPAPVAGGTIRPTAASYDTGTPILIPEDSAIFAMALDGDRLALGLETPEGRRIAYFDIATGRDLGVTPVAIVTSHADASRSLAKSAAASNETRDEAVNGVAVSLVDPEPIDGGPFLIDGVQAPSLKSSVGSLEN